MATRRIVNDAALDTLFRAAHSHYAWLARPVSDTLLRALWELLKLAPTGGVGGPPHLLFVRSEAAKARLAPAVPAGMRAGLIAAPVVAIVGGPIDRERPAAVSRDGGLLAASLILAARALGLDCGPVWEFDREIVDAAFFPERDAASVSLCAIGYGDDTQPMPAEARPGRDAACSIL